MEIKLTKSDGYIIAIFFFIAITVSLYGFDTVTWKETILDTLVYTITCFFCTYIIVYYFFPKYFPKKKIAPLFFWIVSTLIIFGIVELGMYYVIEGASPTRLFEKKWQLPLWAITTSSENAGMLIGVLLGKKFFEAQLEIQTREKEKKESELRLLKSQIDPHFLFNNLNTVDVLIDRDPAIAKEYLNNLSQLYRYLIHTKEDEVVPMDEELAFAKNYIYLMEIRFGDAYRFDSKINTDIDDILIPPGALQTLLENVVKHNAGSTEQPVICEIIIDTNSIVVKNNLQLKSEKIKSTGTGLKNLTARYTLLTDKKVEIKSGQYYSVHLPVIKSVAS